VLSWLKKGLKAGYTVYGGWLAMDKVGFGKYAVRKK
jgi:hypothetical protein